MLWGAPPCSQRAWGRLLLEQQLLRAGQQELEGCVLSAFRAVLIAGGAACAEVPALPTLVSFDEAQHCRNKASPTDLPCKLMRTFLQVLCSRWAARDQEKALQRGAETSDGLLG